MHNNRDLVVRGILFFPPEKSRTECVVSIISKHSCKFNETVEFKCEQSTVSDRNHMK